MVGQTTPYGILQAIFYWSTMSVFPMVGGDAPTGFRNAWLSRIRHPNGLVLLIVALGGLLLAMRTARKWSRSRSRFRIRFFPRTGADGEIFLEVVNEGAPVTLAASLWVSDCSPGIGFRWQRYTGRWQTPDLSRRETYPGSGASACRLEEHGNELLRIASVESPFESPETATMSLEGTSEELHWEKRVAINKPLPYYILNIALKAREYPNTILLTYRVRPTTPLGPLSMDLLP